jgi:hypothetical protein
MIVSRNGLEGRGVRIGECAAWCAEDFANAQVFKRSRRYNGEVGGVKGVYGFRYVCCRIHVVILSIVVLRGLVQRKTGAPRPLTYSVEPCEPRDNTRSVSAYPIVQTLYPQ